MKKKLNLIRKIVLPFFVILIILITSILISTGFFRTINNSLEGQIIEQIVLPGAEDITISKDEEFALISSTDRGHFPPLKEEQGGLFIMDLSTEAFEITKLTTDFEGSFAPHGISMLKKDSIHKILAVNHTAEGHSLEVFSLKNKLLTYERTFKHPLIVSPNDVVYIDENSFYFTNDHKYTDGLKRYLEDYLGLSLSNVIYYDGKKFREVANNIAYANGINYDAKNALLFVASPRKFLIKVYKRNPDGSLDFIEDIDCGTGVDNIEFDSEGNLWVGAHPNLLRFASYAKGKKKTAPSEIIKISYRSKGDYSVEQVYMEDGNIMSGSSVAAPFRDLVLTGNVMDDKFLVLKIEK